MEWVAAIVRNLKNGLLLSCQEPDDSPLNQPGIIAALARSAEACGAVGVPITAQRISGRSARLWTFPWWGLEKLGRGITPVYITPTIASALRVARAGASIVALDCTARQRPATSRSRGSSES